MASDAMANNAPRVRSWNRVRALHLVLVCVLSGCADDPAGADDQRADPSDSAKVAVGAKVYSQHCSACHGAQLKGQPNWRKRLPSGRLPAPPHDDSGHTWHHPDHVLFGIIKKGLVPPYAPQGYASDMPKFAGTLPDDDIWAVLAYIKSRWPTTVLPARAQMLGNSRQ
jgi:mono/diheme cytochrome c family protein